MAKKASELSRPGKQRQVKNGDTLLTDTLEKQLNALKNRPVKPDEETPEINDWSHSEIGKFYRPVKKQITLRLDADTLLWFKQQSGQSGKYQTLINQACREYMVHHHHK